MAKQTPIQSSLHERLAARADQAQAWFHEMRKGMAFPFYSSFDIRDSGFKVAPVDANIYPAGWNNICPTDQESVAPAITGYLGAHYAKKIERICLLAEEHTTNLYYWDNVHALKRMIESAGLRVEVSVPRPLEKAFSIRSANGSVIEVQPLSKEGKVLVGEGFEPDLIISNNDFSDAKERWAEGLIIPINPPRELGWYQRKKSLHFKHYNRLAGEFAKILDVDPWVLQVETDVLFDSDLSFAENRERAAAKADEMLAQIRKKYQEHGIDQEPVLFVKNNSGTYGLAVAQVRNGSEILQWNSKARTKMKAAKGQSGVTELLFQEGIPTALSVDNQTCEPCIYMVGCELAGGFLRAHGEKGPTESLNSPGAVFKKLCVSDLNVNRTESPMENVYGWAAKLSSLAIGHEAQEMGVVYTDYNVDGSQCSRALKAKA